MAGAIPALRPAAPDPRRQMAPKPGRIGRGGADLRRQRSTWLQPGSASSNESSDHTDADRADGPGLDEYFCGSEPQNLGGGCAECTMSAACRCNGFVAFGYGGTWTPWRAVSGAVDCSTTEFGDPYPGHDKVCLCSRRPDKPDEPTAASFRMIAAAAEAREARRIASREQLPLADVARATCIAGCVVVLPSFLLLAVVAYISSGTAEKRSAAAAKALLSAQEAAAKASPSRHEEEEPDAEPAPADEHPARSIPKTVPLLAV